MVDSIVKVGEVILGKAAGAVGSKFLDKSINSTLKWLENKFKGHSKSVKTKAEKNAKSFLNDTGKKLQIIVQNSKNSPVTLNIVDKNFDDPDFSASLQEATMAAARTPSEQKHKLLAELIAQRVLKKPDSLVSLVTSEAINAISKLSSKHLYFLGLVVLTYNIRPNVVPTNPDKQKNLAESWWEFHLSKTLPYVEKLNFIDLRHLVSLSLIDYDSMIGRDFNILIKDKFPQWNPSNYINNSNNVKRLLEFFKLSIQHIILNSVGLIIGTFVHDQLTNTLTLIKWDETS